MKPPSLTTAIFGGLAMASGILYATSPGFNRGINVIVAAIFGIGPEADGCQRSGWWTLCLPPMEVEGILEGFSRDGNALTANVAKQPLQLFGIVLGKEKNLSGPTFDKFWNLINDPKYGSGYVHCKQVWKEYQCFLNNGSMREGYDISRIAIRGGIAEPTSNAPPDYINDLKWYRANQINVPPALK